MSDYRLGIQLIVVYLIKYGHLQVNNQVGSIVGV